MGCPPDPGLAIHMYNIAAQQNHKEACFALTAWYLVGAPGILCQSDTEAYLWAKKAAEQGLAKAEYAVGYFTEMGIGIKRNLPEAKAWYQSALEHGDKRASTRLAGMGRITAAHRSTGSLVRGGTNGISGSTLHGTQAGQMPYSYPQTGYQGSAPRVSVGPTPSSPSIGGGGGNDEPLPVAGTTDERDSTHPLQPRPISQAFGQPLLTSSRLVPNEGQFENSAASSQLPLSGDEPVGDQEGNQDRTKDGKKKKKGWFR